MPKYQIHIVSDDNSVERLYELGTETTKRVELEIVDSSREVSSEIIAEMALGISGLLVSPMIGAVTIDQLPGSHKKTYTVEFRLVGETSTVLTAQFDGYDIRLKARVIDRNIMNTLLNEAARMKIRTTPLPNDQIGLVKTDRRS